MNRAPKVVEAADRIAVESMVGTKSIDIVMAVTMDLFARFVVCILCLHAGGISEEPPVALTLPMRF